MISAFLVGFVLYAMLAGRYPWPFPMVIAVVAGLTYRILAHHEHHTLLPVDRYARSSRFRSIPAGEKLFFCAVWMAFCLAARTPWQPLVLGAVLAELSVWGGRKIRLGQYLALLSAPLSFLMLSALTLLWHSVPEGADAVLVMPWPGGYLGVTKESQSLAGLVTARALGAVSCLYFLSLSTPLPQLLTTLRRWNFPSAATDLAFLIYRYIFVLMETAHHMQNAAQSRLGYGGVRRSIRTTGLVYGGLLAKSYRSAQARFQAMESRTFGTELHFAQGPKDNTPPGQHGALIGVTALFAALMILN